jgi:hypothetical protein
MLFRLKMVITYIVSRQGTSTSIARKHKMGTMSHISLEEESKTQFSSNFDFFFHKWFQFLQNTGR